MFRIQSKRLMKYPIGIVSFDRPHYLAEHLKSLSAQAGRVLSGREIHLFQDGAATGQHRYANQDNIDECIRLFRKTFPRGFVHTSEENIGHIRNVLRMEEFFFAGTAQWPAAMFFEDDLVVSRHYVSAMDRLIAHALEAGDVSYVRCIHPGRPDIGEQRLNKHKTFLAPTGPMWGYGITREYWQKERAVLDPFYCMAETHPYRALDQNLAQLQWWRIDAPIQFSELDYAKVAATKYLGYAQLGTYCLAARYIGKQGVHYNADIFERLGWHLLQLFTEPLGKFDFPSAEEKRAAIVAQREANLAGQRIKLNLGIETECHPTMGWLNINRKYGFDLANVPLRPFKDDSVEVVYSSHVLQQLQPQHCVALLRDIHRVLKADGVVRISGLSLEILTEQMLQGDCHMESYLDAFWPERDHNRSAAAYYLRLLGSGTDLYGAASEYGQITPLDFHSIAYMLIAAGFEPSKIRRCRYRSSSLAELREGSFDSRANHSFFVEAVK